MSSKSWWMFLLCCVMVAFHVGKPIENQNLYLASDDVLTSNGLKSDDLSKTYLDPVLKLDAGATVDGIRHVAFSATGFSVAYDKEKDLSYVLTNNHFCQSVPNVPMEFFYELSSTQMSIVQRYISGDLKVIDQQPSSDLCLLSTTGFIQPVKIVSKDYQVSRFEPVKIVGSPMEIFPIIEDSYITNTIEVKDFAPELSLVSPALLLSSLTYHGQSGSPVFNKNGEVIGIVTITLMGDGKLRQGGLAIPFQDFYPLLERNHLLVP